MEPTVEWPDHWMAASPTCFSLCAVYAVVLRLNDWQSRLGRKQYRVSIVSPGNPFISINFSKLFFLLDDARFFSSSSHSHISAHLFKKLWTMDQQFNLQIITVHTRLFHQACTWIRSCAYVHKAQLSCSRQHWQKCTYILHIKHTQTVSWCFLILCILQSSHFPSPAVANEILITMHYRDDVLGLQRSSVCVCISVFLGTCVLPANDRCFGDLLPSFFILLSVSPLSLFSLALSPLILSFTLLFLPPPPLSAPLCLPTPDAGLN